MSNWAALSLGSNLGNREKNLKQALKMLENDKTTKIRKVSSVYETEPVGYKNQAWFLNLAVIIDTDLEPHDLLEHIKKIELSLKRVKTIKWGPRTIDIDILLYKDIILNETDLVIPHPEMTNRAFVLVPLLEIEPEIKDPWGVPLKKALEILKDTETVQKTAAFNVVWEA
ncbi:MAG: 2-amino-4-hydroxy-6-hydroxymethyldihydropteridine diphosphokinase [Thermosediminibacterales bacterium]|nr:2-amino-4-hydroxy-6-hydroxymethyldihydropteridine diphosphokinase [Thermosediminibacterales bacterium]MDK2836121.1 2-amino-4-hydroxy-6-hydroxymethyldihydropteridine diphosphokinase [Thermosediminibacterales bacterium]